MCLEALSCHVKSLVTLLENHMKGVSCPHFLLILRDQVWGRRTGFTAEREKAQPSQPPALSSASATK